MEYVFQGFQRVQINKSNQVCLCVMLMCLTAAVSICVHFSHWLVEFNSFFFIHSFVFGWYFRNIAL